MTALADIGMVKAVVPGKSSDIACLEVERQFLQN